MIDSDHRIRPVGAPVGPVGSSPVPAHPNRSARPSSSLSPVVVCLGSGGGRLVGQQQLGQRGPGPLDAGVAVFTFMPSSHGRTQAAAKGAGAGVYHAHAADTDRVVALVVAQHRDVDPGRLGRGPDGRALGDGDLLPSMVRVTVRCGKDHLASIVTLRPSATRSQGRPLPGGLRRPGRARRSSRRSCRAAAPASAPATRPEPVSSGWVSSRSGSQSSPGCQPSRMLNTRLARTIRRAVRRSSAPSTSQPVTADSSGAHSSNGSRNTPRRNLHKIIESMTAARSSVSIAAATWASPPEKPVEVAGQVRLVGTGSVVVGAPGVHRQAERHGVHGARLIAGQFQALDVRCELRRAAADLLRRPPRALGEQGTKAVTCAGLRQRPHQRARVAEPQPRRIDQAPLGALHRPGDRAARRDGVQAQFVTQGAGGEHRVGI